MPALPSTMLQIEPEGSMSVAIAAVRVSIASCAAWHTWAGVATLDAAERTDASAKRLHYYALPRPSKPSSGYTREELETLRPAGGLSYSPPNWIGRSTEGVYSRSRSGNEHFGSERAYVFLHIADDVSRETRHDDAYVLMKFTNRLGLLIDDLLDADLANVEGSAFIQRVAVVAEPHRADEVHAGTKGDFVQALLRIDTGLR